MGNRGLWNQHVEGKWYRFFQMPRAITSPEAPATLKALRHFASETYDLKPWERVPFPSPLHKSLDFVYTIDKDRGLLTLTQWKTTDDVRYRLTRQVKLVEIYDPSIRTLDAVLADKGNVIEQFRIPRPHPRAISPTLNWTLEQPTPLNELQFRFFTGFVRLWRFYLDDLLSWSNRSLLRTMAIGVLRIAAWDFGVLFDTDTEDEPVRFSSVPRWSAPAHDIFWFHGFLVTLYSPFETFDQAVGEAQAYLEKSQHSAPVVRVLLLSLSHITLVEISGPSVKCSPSIPLITNTSALRPSPGFRALASLLTSQPRTMPRPDRERWGVSLPTEILDMILKALPPKDLVSFIRASSRVERQYYDSPSSILLKLGSLHVRSFEYSRPCCGERYPPAGGSVSCSVCYAWSHAHCLGLGGSLPPSDAYTCPVCQQDRTCGDLEIGGIHRMYRQGRFAKPARCKVAVGGGTKLLTLRTSTPAARRPALPCYCSAVTGPPGEIKYTICFNGAFSGLAYGLEDCDKW